MSTSCLKHLMLISTKVVCGYRLLAFCLIIVGFLLNCHQIADQKEVEKICVPEPRLNIAFWFLIACAFAIVLGGLVYDLRRKRHLEQALPKYVETNTHLKGRHILRWFWYLPFLWCVCVRVCVCTPKPLSV